jgi:micrococcal nuclease
MFEYKVIEIVKIVDGDTIDCVLDLGFGIYYKQRVRLHGIDAPESNSADSRERGMADESTGFFTRWISENKKNLIVQTFKDDKYGRMLGRFRTGDGRCVNDEMVKLGFAWVYDKNSTERNLDQLDAIRKQSREVIE